ncbi:MAG: DNA methyltransferase, partial [Chloroflexales bacterium]
DIQTIVIHTNFVNTVKQTSTLSLDDLEKTEGLQLLRKVFFTPRALEPALTIQKVTEEAAADFADLADLLRRYGEPPQAIAHYLIRLLFCLFAEDVGLLPTGLFTEIITATRHKAAAFVAQVQDLFAKMAVGGYFGSQAIKHFNGGLFEDNTALPLDSDGLAILARVSALDWSAIEPSIFGTLFERSLDSTKRSQLGAHYTSRDDIMLIVEPVLMAPVRRQWAEVEMKARELAAQRDAASGAKRNKLENELSRLLMNFAGKLSSMRVLDAACGSGNFLYVALKQLLDLELKVINLGADLGLTRMLPTVGPEQLYGLEINELAHELAQVTVWIGYIQWHRDNGFAELREPILQPLDTIKHMDAILAFDESGKPVEPEWPEADVIIGNPPFLGDKKMRGELGDGYVEALRRLYAGRVPGGADLVTYWFERARALIEQGQVKRAGLLATQTIRQKQNRQVVARIKASGNVFMAWSDRPWILDGAAIRVSMVGFDDGTETIRVLDGHLVGDIHINLTASLDLTQAEILVENTAVAFIGDSKKGSFDIPKEVAIAMLSLPLNSNGRPNSDVVRPYANAYDITQGSRNMWIVDFGVTMSESEASGYTAPYEYVRQHVKPERDLVRNILERTKWWLHARPAPDFRAAVSLLPRFIVTPQVSKHRVFSWLDPKVLPAHKLIAFAREDDYFMGILHACTHEVWVLATSSRHGDGTDGGRPTYTPTTCFVTYPFPWPPGKEPQGDPCVEAIAAAAKRLVELRDAWLNEAGLSEAELKKRTLTNLYNERPPWLDQAHKALDQAVFTAYGWPYDLSDEEILTRLLALNLARAAG